MYTHTHIHVKVHHPFCTASSPSLLHSEPPVAGSSGQWSAWWPTPLLVCWSSGNITFSALWRLWCWCHSRFSSFSSSSSSCSPGSLPFQQVTVGMKRVQVHEQIILRRWRVAALLTHVQLVAALLVGICLGDAVDLLHVGLQWAALGEGLLAEGTLVWTDPCVGKKGVTLCLAIPIVHACKDDAVCILPVCVRTCRLRSKVSLKPFPQKLQRCLFVSLWHLICRFNIRWWWKTFWHTCKQQLWSTTTTVLQTMVEFDQWLWHTWHANDEFWLWAVDLVTMVASSGAELVFKAATYWFVAGALEMGVCEEGPVTAGSSPVVTCEGNR